MLIIHVKEIGNIIMRVTCGAKYDHLPHKSPHEIRITSFFDNNHARHIPITIWLGVHGIYANPSITDERALVKQIHYKVEGPIHSN